MVFPDTPFPLRSRTAVATGLLASFLVVAVVALFTPPQPPLHDSLWYVRMAQDGISGNTQLAAPYAYRPAAPLIVWAAGKLFGLDAHVAFRVLVWVSAIVLLFISFQFARSRGSSPGEGLFVLCAVGWSFFHIKYPLTMYAMVDVEAYPLMIAATWALVRDRLLISLMISAIGLLFKEFLLVPLALVLIVAVFRSRSHSSMRYSVLAFGALAAFGVFFVLPRILIPVQIAFGANLEWPFRHPDTFRYVRNLPTFLASPLDGGRALNVVYAAASYWLPTILLVTTSRLKTTWAGLAGIRSILIWFLGLVLVLVFVGGTNVMIFVTYSVPVQIVCLAILLKKDVSVLEATTIVIIIFVFNRIWMRIPSFEYDFPDAIDVYGGWSSRISGTTVFRSIEMAAYVVLVAVVRSAHARMSGLPKREVPASSTGEER